MAAELLRLSETLDAGGALAAIDFVTRVSAVVVLPFFDPLARAETAFVAAAFAFEVEVLVMLALT